jgi:hypothetical protein
MSADDQSFTLTFCERAPLAGCRTYTASDMV